MYISDWLETIGDYLRMTRRDALSEKGRVTHEEAMKKAHEEFEKHKAKQMDEISLAEKRFLASIKTLEKPK